MTRKPALLFQVVDIASITVSDNPTEGAILRFTMDGELNDLELKLPAVTVARLQTLLIEADAQQANLVTTQ
ncbi:hypothetical protein QO058_14080 [Bosea vestrisii]|uniref:hypothetical protein n=1 Tax=Bosea vestrisii TaxID=151416 RepID=UPI0024DF4105|nr:hypothetical protein [Bosea vestrisii]WID99265.1 hypothetical protein QO058_14080 [Bosea vestrisii]